jgi:hypothetical protein
MYTYEHTEPMKEEPTPVPVCGKELIRPDLPTQEVEVPRHFSDFDPADSIPLTALVCESGEVFSPGRCKTQERGQMGGESFMNSHEELTRCVRIVFRFH